MQVFPKKTSTKSKEIQITAILENHCIKCMIYTYMCVVKHMYFEIIHVSYIAINIRLSWG